MSFVISRNGFMDVVQKTFPVIPSKTSLQVLNNFKMSFSSDKLEIMASDLDNFVRASTPISGDGDAEIAVNAKKLMGQLKEIGDEQLTINIENNELVIENETGFRCKITGVDLQEFPHFPESGYDDSHTIESGIFKRLVNNSSFAVSKDGARACLCGVLWEFFPERTGMVATDGHRLGASFVDVALGFDDDTSIIVPNKSLQHIAKNVDILGSDSINFSISDKHIVFSTDSFTLSSKLIDGPYPDYDKGIPKEFSKTAIIDKTNLLGAVKRVTVASNKPPHLVKIAFSESSMEVAAKNIEDGYDAKQTLPTEYNGDDDHLIGFNGIYLSEILSIIDSEKVRIEMNSQVSATVIFPAIEDGEEKISDDLFLIMPLRITD
jgi:DNA polymerase-3 subunit beta